MSGGPVLTDRPISFHAIALAVLICGLEFLFFLGDSALFHAEGSISWRHRAIIGFGVWSNSVEFLPGQGGTGIGDPVRFITFPLIHRTTLDALLSATFILVVFRVVQGSTRDFALVLTFLGSAVVGAACFYQFSGSQLPLTGASAGYLGLFGFAAAALVMAEAVTGQPIGRIGHTIIILPALFLGFELVMGMLIGGSGRWIADLSGYMAGFLAAPPLMGVRYGVLIERIADRLRK